MLKDANRVRAFGCIHKSMLAFSIYYMALFSFPALLIYSKWGVPFTGGLNKYGWLDF